jgi:hypothetical protein
MPLGPRLAGLLMVDHPHQIRLHDVLDALSPSHLPRCFLFVYL